MTIAEAPPDQERRHRLFVMSLASLAATTAAVFSTLTPSYTVAGGERGERNSVKPGTGKPVLAPEPTIAAMKRARQIEAGIAQLLTKAKIDPLSDEAAFVADLFRRYQMHSTSPKVDRAVHTEQTLAAFAELTKEASKRIAAYEANQPIPLEPEEPPPPPPKVVEEPKLDKEAGIDDDDD